MARKLVVFAFLISIFAASLFVGDKTESTAVEKGDFSASLDGDGVDVYFFYGEGCPHCDRVEPFLAEMEQKYPLKLHKYDMYGDRSCILLFDEYCNKYGLPRGERGVPTVFVSDSYFVGDIPILDGLEEEIERALQDKSIAGHVTNVENSEGSGRVTSTMDGVSLLTVTVAALLDSISPCSIAILVFLIGARILVANRKKRALTVGLSFCLSVFIAYFLFGLGLFTVVQVSGLSNFFGILTGLIALSAGVFYLKDAFGSRLGGFKMEVPGRLKPLLMKMLKGVTTPVGAFLMGFVVCLFELPCTGGLYLFILGQLANTATRLQAIPLLFYYNFIFILPLILISLLLYSNLFSIGKIRAWNEKNKRLLRLGGGLAMIGLGFFAVPISQIFNLVLIFLRGYRIFAPILLVFISSYLFFSSQKRKNSMSTLTRIPARSFLLIPLILVSLFVTGFSNVGHRNGGSQREGVGMADPAAVYCSDLGYEYEIVDSDEGQYGMCVFPDGGECDAWRFLEGRCGREYSYCARKGYDLTMKVDGKNSFSGEYAVCIDGKEEMGSVVDLYGLSQKAIKRSFSTEKKVPIQGESVSAATLPISLDWRNKDGENWMTRVKSQGGCGACWVFATVGVVEAVYNVHANVPALDLDLSEQMLLSDCFRDSYTRGNCCGGRVSRALGYIKENGIVDEDCFAYVDGTCGCDAAHAHCDSDRCAHHTDGQCSNTVCSDKCSDWENRIHSITDYGDVHSREIREKLVEKGPLSAVIGWGSSYGGHWDGDIYRCDSDSGFNHAIVLAGYNDTGGYWIAKNSWGSSWDGDGYFKIGYGECRVEDWVHYVYHKAECKCDLTGPDGTPDWKVDMRDVGFAGRAFGSYPGHPRWNATADTIEDDYIDMKDLMEVARRVGKYCIT